MTVSHKEALRAAREVVRERMASMSQFLTLSDMWDEQDEIHFRAYLDARGMVMMPTLPTQAMLDEVTAPDQSEPFSDMTMSSVYRQMLAAAPDPFGGE